MNVTLFVRHQFGHVFDSNNLPQTAEEAIVEAGLDWNVNKEEMFLQDGSRVDGNYAMRRNDNQNILGIVGSRYTPLQNIEAFSFFDDLVKDGLAEYHIAGSSLEGRKVWILAKFKDDLEIAEGDTVEKYVLLSSSHDGSGSVLGAVTPLRVVCSNMLSAMRRRGAKKNGEYVSIRHTKTIGAKVSEAAKTLKTVQETYKALGETWSQMAEYEMAPVAIDNYFKAVVPDSPNAENPYKTIAVRTEMHHYLQSGRGSELELQNTLWGAYNAVTEYMTHEVSDRKGSTFDKHMDSLWFGPRGKRSNKAMEVALELLAR